MRTATIALLPFLSGCVLFPEFMALQEKLDGLMNPLIAQGMVVGVEESESESVSELMALTSLEPGTSVSIFLADAEDADNAEDAPVNGARVKVDRVRAVEATEGGTYVVSPEDGLPYADGETWHVDIDRFSDQSEVSSLSVMLPPGADVDLPEFHDPYASLTLDLAGQGFTAVMVVVINQYGFITHDSQPETVTDLVVFAKSDEEIDSYVIPGDAFAEEGAYAVGVAGLNHSDPSSIENLNTFASTVMAGKIRFQPLAVFSEPPEFPY
jgi:hypothetical protein